MVWIWFCAILDDTYTVYDMYIDIYYFFLHIIIYIVWVIYDIYDIFMFFNDIFMIYI